MSEEKRRHLGPPESTSVGAAVHRTTVEAAVHRTTGGAAVHRTTVGAAVHSSVPFTSLGVIMVLILDNNSEIGAHVGS